MMNEWTTAALLGVVEGLTEFLPVSSTGHLLLAESFLTHQTDMFNVVIQVGAVLAVLLLFSQRLRQLWRDRREKHAQLFVAQLGTAFAITAVGGLLLKGMHYRLRAELTPVAVTTLVGGVIFVAVEARLAKRPNPGGAISWAVAVAMGLAQVLAAALPGTSRSGSTILAALMLGTGRPQAAEFSFLLGIPTLMAAGGLELVQAIIHPHTEVAWGPLMVGAAVAAVVAFVTVRWLLSYVRAHSFAGFGWYRILLGLTLLLAQHWGLC